MTQPVSIDYSITEGDYGKVLTATLLDADRVPVDLSDANEVRIRIGKPQVSTLYVDAAAIAHPDQTTHPGEVSYTFPVGSTDEVGDYRLRFRVTWGNKRVTFPTKPLYMRIEALIS